MAVNDLTYEQAAAVMNDLHKQVTGQEVIGGVNSGNFTSVAQAVLKDGVDPVLKAISQMVGRTIMSVRPYTRKLAGIQVDQQRWGYITRKLAIADKPFEDDASYTIEDGGVYSHWYVNLPNALQLNYYGQNAFEKSVTLTKNQLNGAFASLESFASWVSMVMQNAQDMIEQSRESMARMTLGNYITGRIASNTGVIHLVSEYNAEMGTTLTWPQIRGNRDNYEMFVKWMYARVSAISNMFTERTALYQTQVTGKVINRHTPVRYQKFYMVNDFMFNMNSRVLSDTFNANMLKYADVEALNFWQSPENPYSINMNPAYLQADGTITAAAEPTLYTDIIGVLFDRDALGITVMDEWSADTGLNAKYGYNTRYFHYLIRFWNDFTEKGVVFKLD